MRIFYSALLLALLPVLLLRTLWRSRRAPDYRRRLGERLGRVVISPPKEQPVICLHAASVGEVQSSLPLVQALQREYPQHTLLLTTTTPTGSKLALELFGAQVLHQYLPLDVPFAVNRFLDQVQPELLLLLETELWPNLIAAASRRGCACVSVSARLSATSAGRYRLGGPVVRQMLERLSAIACQTDEDAGRFLALGAKPDAVRITGSLKFDVSLEPCDRSLLESLRRDLSLEERGVWVAGSTHAGEEPLILEAFARVLDQLPEALLILAPRHPERFDALAQRCRTQGWNLIRRSEGLPLTSDVQVLLLDTIGELPLFYGLARAAFIGGSLVNAGGHNPLEALRWSVPVATGPFTENFAHLYDLLERNKIVTRVRSAGDISQIVLELLEKPERSAMLGARGSAMIQAHGGATEDTLDIVRGLLAQPCQTQIS